MAARTIRRDDERRRRREWEVLAEAAGGSLLRCQKCPIWSLCPHQKRELVRDLQFKETQYQRPPYAFSPLDQGIEEFKEGLEVMEAVKEKCPLVKIME